MSRTVIKYELTASVKEADKEKLRHELDEIARKYSGFLGSHMWEMIVKPNNSSEDKETVHSINRKVEK